MAIWTRGWKDEDIARDWGVDGSEQGENQAN